MLFYSVFVKCILQDFVIFNIFVIEFSRPLYFSDIESVWVNCINNLAKN